MYVDTEACLVGIQVSGKISYSTGLLRVKYGGMGGKEREGERRSHSSRSIGVPEVIGNDKVGKMREGRIVGKSGTARRPSGWKYGRPCAQKTSELVCGIMASIWFKILMMKG